MIRRSSVLAALVAFTVGSAQGVTIASASAASRVASIAATPRDIESARRSLDMLRQGVVDRATLTPELNVLLTPAVLREIAQKYSTLGAERDFAFVEGRAYAETRDFLFSVTFAKKKMNWYVATTSQGKIASVLLSDAESVARPDLPSKSESKGVGAESDGTYLSKRCRSDLLRMAAAPNCP